MTNFVYINGYKTFYKQKGKGKNLLLLHGWGGNKDCFGPFFDNMAQYFCVTAIDFWGFGQSDVPPKSADTFWYAKMTRDFISTLGLFGCNVVAHSFGGRVALILSQEQGVFDKVVLCASAGIKPRFSLKKYIKIKKYKLAKKLGKKTKRYGSNDYKNLSADMQCVFVRVVNDFLESCAKNTVANVLLVWGKKDKTTPLYMAKKLNRLIKNSGLVVINDGGHFCFLDDYYTFNLVVESFFGVL